LTRSNRLVFCAALACVALPASLFATITYTDTSFPTASYPAAFTYISNDSTGGQIGSVSDGSGPAQCASCGDPGQALETVITVTAPGDTSTTLEVGVINSAFTYTPATHGALWTITTSIDESDANSAGGYSDTDVYELLIEQDANYYYGLVNDITALGFELLSASDLVASNFDQFNTSTGVTTATSHPNFSGDTMEFGLLIVGGSVFAPANTETLIYDNLSLSLTTVPEPSSLFLMGAALAGLTLLRHRKLE
jgi:hypothetical protein